MLNKGQVRPRGTQHHKKQIKKISCHDPTFLWAPLQRQWLQKTHPHHYQPSGRNIKAHRASLPTSCHLTSHHNTPLSYQIRPPISLISSTSQLPVTVPSWSVLPACPFPQPFAGSIHLLSLSPDTSTPAAPRWLHPPSLDTPHSAVLGAALLCCTETSPQEAQYCQLPHLRWHFPLFSRSWPLIASSANLPAEERLPKHLSPETPSSFFSHFCWSPEVPAPPTTYFCNYQAPPIWGSTGPDHGASLAEAVQYLTHMYTVDSGPPPWFAHCPLRSGHQE